MDPVTSTHYPLPDALLRLLTPAEDISVSHWCDRHRYLTRRFAAEPGPWRTRKTPYLREMLDAFADPTVESIMFVKCARVGGTEWVNNILGYTADARPMPVMYVQPTRPDVEDEFTGRLRSVFESSKKLRTHVPGGEWAGQHELRLDSMDIYGAWANSPGTMIRKTIGVAIFEEINNCERSAGFLGNTLKVLSERLVTFGYRAKLIADGTPTTEDAAGWRMWQQSDQRHYHVPCPVCGTYQPLHFPQLVALEDERDFDRIVDEKLARYKCGQEACAALLEWDLHHAWMMARGVWLPKGCEPIEPLPLDDAEICERLSLTVPPYDPFDDRYAEHQQWTPRLRFCDAASDPDSASEHAASDPRLAKLFRARRRGYRLSALYSPFPTRSWSHILAEWWRVHDKPDELRVFMNSWLGEAWEDAVEKTDIALLGAKRQNSYPEGMVPPGAKILLMGADKQKDRLYYTIRAWGAFEESWLIRHGTVTTHDQLYDIAFHAGFPVIGRPDVRLRCHALAIDSRYEQDQVYEFARRPGVYPVKGEQSADYRHKARKVEHFADGRPVPWGLMVYLVNTAYFKSKITRLMNLPEGQPGHWHLHTDTTTEYLQHVTNEHQKRLPVGPRHRKRYELVWTPKTDGARVDWFDCEVYGAALADLFNVPLLREDSPMEGLMAPGNMPPAPKAASRDEALEGEPSGGGPRASAPQGRRGQGSSDDVTPGRGWLG